MERGGQRTEFVLVCARVTIPLRSATPRNSNELVCACPDSCRCVANSSRVTASEPPGDSETFELALEMPSAEKKDGFHDNLIN